MSYCTLNLNKKGLIIDIVQNPLKKFFSVISDISHSKNRLLIDYNRLLLYKCILIISFEILLNNDKISTSETVIRIKCQMLL